MLFKIPKLRMKNFVQCRKVNKSGSGLPKFIPYWGVFWKRIEKSEIFQYPHLSNDPFFPFLLDTEFVLWTEWGNESFQFSLALICFNVLFSIIPLDYLQFLFKYYRALPSTRTVRHPPFEGASPLANYACQLPFALCEY